MTDKKTDELDNILNYINSEEELDKFLNDTFETASDNNFVSYLKELILNNNLTRSDLISNADINRTYGYQILNGTKRPSRDNILKIALGNSFTLDETNKLLTLGGHNKLYVKIKRDSLIIFCLNKKLSLIDTNLFLDKHNIPILE